MDISALQIEFAGQLMKNCGSFLNQISQKSPQQLSDTTRQKLDSICKLTEELIEKLQNPRFRLAFIGATSGGKSTLVNALIGNAIVPMEASEMSAGVVQIFNEDRENVQLDIQAPIIHKNANIKGELWKEFHGEKSFEETYDKLQETMRIYHNYLKTHEERDFDAPQVEVHLPVMLAREKERLLRLSPNIDFEMIDLPGIKEMNDTSNLKVNQKLLNRTVLVITLSYEDTSEERLDKLLGEVRKVVEAFKSSNTIFFVLNKTDMWQKKDMPLSDKLVLLQERIAPIVGVTPEEIIISPIKAMQMFLYQAAYGISAKSMSNTQIKYLAHGMAKYPIVSRIRDHKEESPALECCYKALWTFETIAELDKLIESGLDSDGDPISSAKKEYLEERLADEIKDFRQKYLDDFLKPEVQKKILEQSFNKSGCDKFIQTLAKRIEDYLPQLVIQPTVHEWITNIEELKDSINGEKIAILESIQKDFNDFVNNLNQTQKTLSDSLTDIKHQIATSFNNFTSALTGGDFKETSQALEEIRKNEFLSPFDIINKVLQELKREASDNILKNVIKNYLEIEYRHQTPNVLAEKLRQMGCGTTESFHFSQILKQLAAFYYNHPDSKLKVDKSSFNAEKVMQEYRDLFVNAQISINQLLGSFFQRRLQSKVSVFEEKMKDVISNIRNKLFSIIIEKCCESEEIAKGIVPSNSYICHDVHIKFDTDELPLLHVNTVIAKTETSLDYRVRTWKEFWKNTPYWLSAKKLEIFTYTPHDVPEEVHTDYLCLDLPSIKKLVLDWDMIISQSSELIIDTIGVWFRKNGDGVIDFFNTRVPEIINNYKGHAEGVRDKKEEEKEEISEEWTAFGNMCQENISGTLTKMNNLIQYGKIEE
ncbi:MAG: dynamin family protein [Thermoguttaceae bacterium]|nr:dynamin family protein [Thermoguttaceae bacterium]